MTNHSTPDYYRELKFPYYNPSNISVCFSYCKMPTQISWHGFLLTMIPLSILSFAVLKCSHANNGDFNSLNGVNTVNADNTYNLNDGANMDNSDNGDNSDNTDNTDIGANTENGANTNNSNNTDCGDNTDDN